MADASAEEVSSPTTLVMRYLQSKGVSPNMKNYGAQVRAALEANAKDPTLIPGLRNDTAATEADDQAAMRAAGNGGSRSGGGGGGRSTLPADLTHGPTNEADWQPNTTKTSSASPTAASAQDVLAMQNATNPAMRAGVPDVPVQSNAEYVGNAQPASGRSTTINPDALPGPRNASLAYQQPTSLEEAMIEALSGPHPQGMLPPPPRQITGPPSAPEAPMASPNTPIPMPGEPAPPQAPPGLQVENVPMPSPQQTIQAPSASSIPPSGGLSIEDRMMPGRGNLTIQAPNASSMPATTPPVIQETAPSFKRMLGGAATGAGAGRIMGPGGMALGAILGAAPEAWNLGKHIIGR